VSKTEYLIWQYYFASIITSFSMHRDFFDYCAL